MKTILTIFLLCWSVSLYALTGPDSTVLPVRDSLLPVWKGSPLRFASGVDDKEKALNSELVDIEYAYSVTRDPKRTFTRLFRIARRRKFVLNRKARARLYNDLAGISARLRLYPIAMQCYYAAEHEPDLAEQAPDLAAPAPDLADSANPGGPEDQLPEDDSIPAVQPLIARSLPVTIQSILSAFADGKNARAYALLVEVKQPIAGKRKTFTHINNVGHTFITLIKYNRDSSIVSRSFGFYPHKTGPLSGTPFHPTSPSVLKDDARHDWDELAGKFISYRRFKKVIATLAAYDHTLYNLNHNNCTDFGLAMAQLAGISIDDAKGQWPFGEGNNPGSAGQSILEGKTQNTDTTYPEPLFIRTNNLPTTSNTQLFP